jgi:hypothetical protein
MEVPGMGGAHIRSQEKRGNNGRNGKEWHSHSTWKVDEVMGGNER